MARPATLDFLRTEAGAGVLLALAALAALVMANSSLAGAYFSFINAPAPVRVGPFDETRSVLGWVRDGLMTVFFLVVGLEIKFEVLRGEFSSPRRLALPVLAALGGMVGPALVFLAVNAGPGGTPRAWPIPTPTDVAFSLAALAVFGRRLPEALRLFLMTLAVADDLGAIALIGVLFRSPLHLGALALAAGTLGLLAGLAAWCGVPRLVYAAGFILVWAFVLHSGLNTSLAGLACALTVPIEPRRPGQEGLLKVMMQRLHPYVAYGVMPLFAFVSAGFTVGALGLGGLLAPMPLGVALGLILGKPLGVVGFSVLATVLRLGRRPLDVRWLELAGVGLLCGAGFTMSFFIGALALPQGDALAQSQLRAAVMGGSLLSVFAGWAVLAWAARQRDQTPGAA